MKRVSLFITVILLCALASAQNQKLSRSVINDPTMQVRKFNQFYGYLTGTYLDTINNVKLIEEAIKKTLAELDPHSAYIPASDMQQVTESFEGSFSGIGIEFNILHDTLIVVNTIVGAPAERVGLRPNDRIVAIDSKDVIGIKQADVPKKLRGPKGTVVELSVIRHGEPSLLMFRITRDNIPINTIDAAYKLDKNTGYIKVNRFANTTMKEFNESLSAMGKIGALVVDLRSNGGGLMDQAIEMSNLFLPKGAVIVSAEGRKLPKESFTADVDGKLLNVKLVVLVDEYSASSSEIVAGAIQDWDRGLIVGRRSFGKGLVQRQFPLVDGSAVRITIAHYHTPTGRVIQRPYELGDQKGYYTSRYELMAKDNIDTLHGQTYKTLRKGRTVYGGGGIYPDVFVPVDTTGFSVYWSKLVQRGVITDFVIEYVADNREKLQSSYSDFDKYLNEFTVDNTILKALTDRGVTNGVELDQSGFDVSRKEIAVQIKALIAQKLWSTNEYFRVINQDDNDSLKKAIEILREWNKYAKDLL